jgi:hypothetical protein
LARLVTHAGATLIVLASVIVGVVGCAVAAYAAFAAGGSGTGIASVGTSTGRAIHATTGGALYPGTSTTVSFMVDNGSGGRQLVGTIHLASIVACDRAFVSGACPGGHELTSCESINNGSSSNAGTNNFYMADVVANQEVAAGNGQSITATGTLTMNNLASSQDSCKNGNLLLNLTS